MRKRKNNKNFSRQGFGIIEILIVVFIISTALVSLMELYSFYIKTGARNQQQLQAISLAQEAMEAAHSARDESWANIANLTAGEIYHPATSTEPIKWTLVSGEETINGFRRQVVFENVYRDASDNIAESGFSDDGTRKITVNVLWQESGEDRSVELDGYLMNWRQQ